MEQTLATIVAERDRAKRLAMGRASINARRRAFYRGPNGPRQQAAEMERRIEKARR